MATNDGATTELFTGWSSVVHQPEDEPEESELPSTVDIGALSAGPSDPTNPAQNDVESDSDSEDSEGDSSNSEASDESCSRSDSSDSDSSSSSESSSRSPSPEFSVKPSQSNGLRLTIATVRKSIGSPINTVKKVGVENNSSKILSGRIKGHRKSTSSSSSECSSESETESDSKSSVKDVKKHPINPKSMQNMLQPSKRPLALNKLKGASNVGSRSGSKDREVSSLTKEKEKLSPASKHRAIHTDPATPTKEASKDSAAIKLSPNNDSSVKGKDIQKEKSIDNKQKLVIPKLRSSVMNANIRNMRDKSTPKKDNVREKKEPSPVGSSNTGSRKESGRENKARGKDINSQSKLQVLDSSDRKVGQSKNDLKVKQSLIALNVRASSNNRLRANSRENTPLDKRRSSHSNLKSKTKDIKRGREGQTSTSRRSGSHNSNRTSNKDTIKESKSDVKSRTSKKNSDSTGTVTENKGKPVSSKGTRDKESTVETKTRSSNRSSTAGDSITNKAKNTNSIREEKNKNTEKKGTSDVKTRSLHKNIDAVTKEKDTEKSGVVDKLSKPERRSGKKKVLKKRAKKMASLPLSRSSNYSTSDSESSDDLLPASCSLQEIRQEDLAAILPDQNDCNDFNDFDKNDKGSPATGDMSGSDMELPQQAINSLIQRTTESSSDGEGHQLPNPQTLFANSLLQQFVASNPLLSPPTNQNISNTSGNETLESYKSVTNTSTDTMNCQTSMSIVEKDTTESCDGAKTKESREEQNVRRRGRPARIKKGKGAKTLNKVNDVANKNVGNNRHLQDFCGAPNVSPDSGIQNSPDHVSSPEPSLSPNLRHTKTVQNKDDTRKKSFVPFESKSVGKTTSKAEKSSHGSKITSQEKAKEPINKLPVTSNQFDRVLYANSDRVLYPPRRRAGRPANVRRPGRPPKHKSDSSEGKISNQKVQNLKTKGRGACPVSNNKSRQTALKSKSITLKVPKIFHSKHKHRHKKRKIKILKPVVCCDPKINQEIEKLIIDFMKFCVIATKQPKEALPEQILKTLKKVTKKRRTTDHIEKKKKKQSVSTTVNKVHNSNEQRLPLKKRHYHLVSNSSENQKNEADESKNKVPEEIEEVKSEVKTKTEKKDKVGKVTPKIMPVIKSHTNNNEYEVKSEKNEKESHAHIEEAIEACISKFVEEKGVKNEEKVSPEKIVATTTPKKRHRLENLHSESLNSSVETSPEIKIENVSVNTEEKLEKIKPNVTVESYINELKIKRNLMGSKNSNSSMEEINKKTADENSGFEDRKEVSKNLQVEKTVQVSPESTKKKVRKRRAYNRTGFPSVKKKKKKPLRIETPAAAPEVVEPIPSPVCDRVPKEGEEYTKFMERSSDNSCKELNRTKSPNEDYLSECESLPQDERTDFDMEDSSSRSDSINDGSSELRKGKRSDGEENESMSLLESSIERLKSRLDIKKRKRAKDLKSLLETNTYPKRRRREDSPASSIEPSIENRLRDSTSASGDELVKKSKKIPRWKKRGLVAGLFSDYYKEDDSKRQENAKSSRNLVYNPEEHPYGLLPPPYHCGKYLRCRKVDFQLPYDIWWQHTNSQLPGRDTVPSWNYRKIRTNVYNVKSSTGTCEPQACNCKATSMCGDDCINRLVLSECPATHRCHNQRIQKHDWAPGIEKFMTEDKGWGVRTKEPIKQGEFILEYVGEVVSDQEFKERMNSIYVNDTHHYCLHLDGGLVIDGHRMGSDGRFVNHSCEPNCEIQKWSVNGQFRMALFALRDIEPYEELSYDYNFSLFNPAEGQPCKCGSENCRGVIGGKTQRIRQLPETNVAKNPGRVGRPRKTEAKKKPNATKENSPSIATQAPQFIPQIQVKPMSHQQKCFILEHHCFLLRNLTKVRKVRDRSQSLSSNAAQRQQSATPTDSSAFMNQLNALQKPRNMKTRRIAQVEDDPELNKTVRLAAILKQILEALTSAKDDKGELLSTNLMQLPSKRKVPEFYRKVTDPIDISTIQQNIATGIYKTPQTFDADMTKLFSGFGRFYGRTNDIGIATTKLKKIYNETKQQSLSTFEDILGEKPPPAFVSNRKKNEEEDIIRCICGIPRDEGLMIQCERCMVWQHTECVNANTEIASYHCEICVPREVDYEIPMDEFTEHGHRYYMTLMRGDLQLRQGDTVYVLRDITIPDSDKKHTYLTIGKIDYSELDIFRIERLWKDKDTGKRYAYGHHYLRPHETFHEPTRKFFPNEVMRVPLYEAVPVELIMEHCWVMDINTFCKGRPIGAQEQHVYICEYRVDKAAKMFSKVSKSKFPICTKNFAFERFETRLKIFRTYCPHDVDASLLKGCPGRKKDDKDKGSAKESNSTQSASHQEQSQHVTPVIQRTPTQQKARLNRILLNLLSKLPNKQILDVSYLLEGGRRRKKTELKQ